MAGAEIRSIRERLGLSVIQFATVLGVHASTVHRWEAAGSEMVDVDGVAANVLIALRQRVAEEPDSSAKDAGRAVVEALLLGGALVALAALLAYALRRSSNRPPTTDH